LATTSVTWTVRIVLPADVRACTVHITTTIVPDDNGRRQPYDAFNTINADHRSLSLFNWMFLAATANPCNARLIHSSDTEPPRRKHC
jgi:hypothetical protein